MRENTCPDMKHVVSKESTSVHQDYRHFSMIGASTAELWGNTHSPSRCAWHPPILLRKPKPWDFLATGSTSSPPAFLAIESAPVTFDICPRSRKENPATLGYLVFSGGGPAQRDE